MNDTMDTIWLVKSGERILGPYTTDEISRRIKTKEIVVIDEVISPGTRWSYVRDVATFAAAVEEARGGLMSAREDTEVQGYTDQVTLTDTSESFGKASVVGQDPSFESSQIKDAEFVDKPNTENRAPLSTIRPVKHYGMEGTQPDPSVSPRRSLRAAPGVMIGSVVIVLAVIFAIFSANRPKTGEGDFTSTQALANRAWNRGEFERALELYRRLDASQPGRADVAIRLAQLMVRVSGETGEAKRVAQGVRPTSPETTEAIAMTLGLIALKVGDPREAEKQFDQAGASWIADYNRGVGAMMMQHHQKAVAYFRDAGREPIALLMLARAFIASSDVPKSDARKQAVSALERLIGKDHDFRQEGLVLRAYLEATMGDVKEAARFARRAIETDPDLTSEHFHDPALNLDLTTWSQLLNQCIRAGDEIQNSIGRALISLCLAKANRIEEASKTLQEQLSRAPNDGLLNAVSAYVHLLAGREDAARAALRAGSKEPSRLSRMLQARLCVRERNETCAEEAWSVLASESAPPISALTGLAKIRYVKGDREGAGPLLVKAESMSPRYLPLLRLREETSK